MWVSFISFQDRMFAGWPSEPIDSTRHPEIAYTGKKRT